MRSVLVISTVEHAEGAIRAALDDDVDTVRVVVPAVRQSRLQWLTNADDDARERADAAASRIEVTLPDRVESASAGDPDPLQAAEDALREFAADEIVVVTRPGDEAGWLEEGKHAEIRRRFGLPVRHLVLHGDGPVFEGAGPG